MKTLAVYCGSNNALDPTFQESITQLAEAMASANIDLVYGGSKSGLMGYLANSLLLHKRQVIGVMPKQLVHWEQAHEQLTELHTVSEMAERKHKMADLADGFLALPGGIGTLEEIVEMISWAQLGIHHKPCGLLNINGYYDGLLAFFAHSVKQGLMRQKTLDMILVHSDSVQLLNAMQVYQSPVDFHWQS